MLDIDSLRLLRECGLELQRGFSGLPKHCPAQDAEAMRAVLLETARRLHDNYPYFHPLYAGHMHKPPHPVARLAYALALYLNPNNHSLEGGRASSAMEKEAVAELVGLFGWQRYLGHLTGGGTLANLEALWVAGGLCPGTVVLASTQAHYTHARLCALLGLQFEPVSVDADARMDINALEQRLAAGGVGTVVATVGTTAAGAVDPLHQIVELQERYKFRIHADAAYGGYFTLLDELGPSTRQALQAIRRADSVVIDPHKHGLQPYGCGCILFKDPSVRRFYQHGSPYTYFSADELHLGEISLECSRAGAAAVALWATQRLLPLVRDGDFAADLLRCRRAALAWYGYLDRVPAWLTLMEPELDIVCWAPRCTTATAISTLSRRLYAAAAGHDLHLAMVEYPAEFLQRHWPEVQFDCDVVSCLRSCFVKPEHLEWQAALRDRLETARAAIDSGTDCSV